MSNALHQLNIAYHPLEDRLLLRMTTGGSGDLIEYRLWLTRRFVRLLWDALSQILEAEALKEPRVSLDSLEAFKQFQQSDALAQGDFKTPYRAGDARTPLGTDPLLLSRFQVSRGPEGKQILSLQTQGGPALNLTLNVPLIHSIRKLLMDKVTEAQWDLAGMHIPDEPVFLAETSKTIN
ncbi:MAG: hypothetical protein JW950_09915 [Deltaproteobacteria bacterium]|nr:hypothetical protein [Deltaproteobacteria bacterium]